MIKRLILVLFGFALATVDALAQSQGTFVVTGSMATERVAHTATTLRDGRILIAGGWTDRAEIYDPATGRFTSTGSMITMRAGHTATLLSDGRVLIAGGFVGGSSAEVYDPATGTFTATGNMNSGPGWGAANTLSDGRILITGDRSAEIYNPATGVFSIAGPVNAGSRDAVLLKDGRLLIPAADYVSLYAITGDSLQSIASFPSSKYSDKTATLLANGRVLIAGGDYGWLDDTSNEASIYDPRKGTLEKTGNLLLSRVDHTTTLLPGGRVLITGGYYGGYRSEAEEYDPSTGIFRYVGSSSWGRDGNTATLLPDGRVLITGGYRGDNIPAELYSPPLRAGSSADFNGPLAPASLASLFGSRLALTTERADSLSPPTSLGGISLRVRDSAGVARLAPLLYVSPSQINFEVPAGTAPGNVTIEVVNAPTQVSVVAAQANNVAPSLFAYDDNTAAAYGLRLEPDGKQTVLSVRNTIVLDDRPAYLVLYATGIRNRSSLANLQVAIGATNVPVEYAGPEGSGIPGLDQVNVRLTTAVKGTGVANLVLAVDGIPSNTVSVDIR